MSEDTYRRRPLAVDVRQYPDGDKAQFDVMRWVESHGQHLKLIDIAYRQLDEPADDGSRYQWRFGLLDAGNRYESVRPSDWIVIDELGSVDTYTDERFHQLFERKGSAHD